jgi:hypothetical protein
MTFTVYFEIFGKKLKTTIEANSEEDAKYKVMGKIKWHKITPGSEDTFDWLKHQMGIK